MNRSKFRLSLAASIAACLAISVSGCNRTEWAVKWADTYLSWKIIDQFEFSGSDKKTVKSETTQLVQKFRHTKFPVLADFFHRSAVEAANLDFKAEDIVRSWVVQKLDETDAFMNGLGPEVEPFALKIASLVEKENWESFLQNFEKENQKISKQKSKCTEKFEDELDDWMGSLTEFQKASIDKYCETRKDSQSVRVKNRKHTLEVFRSWAEPQGSFEKVAFEAAVKKWIASYREIQSPEAKSQWKISRDELIKTFTQILLNSNEAQKKRLATTLGERAKSFQRLTL